MEAVLTDRDRCNSFPARCAIEATGLGGSDLPFSDKTDVAVRSDRHGQNVYGPSLTTVEQEVPCSYLGHQVTANATALGISKAALEFHVLHYYATDSL